MKRIGVKWGGANSKDRDMRSFSYYLTAKIDYYRYQ